MRPRLFESGALDNVKNYDVTYGLFYDGDRCSMFPRDGFSDGAAHAASSHSSSPLVRLLMNLWNSTLLMLAASVRYARSTAVSSTICVLIGYLRWKGYFVTGGIPSGEAA